MGDGRWTRSDVRCRSGLWSRPCRRGGSAAAWGGRRLGPTCWRCGGGLEVWLRCEVEVGGSGGAKRAMAFVGLEWVR